LWNDRRIQSRFAYLVELAFQREPIEHVEPQAREDLQTCIQLAKRFVERAAFVLV
jgi:hypothetical protein